MFGERCAEALEVAAAEGDGASPSRTVGRVGESNELVSVLVHEELDDRREAAVARALLQGELLQDLCLPPGCRRLRHDPRLEGKSSREARGMCRLRNIAALQGAHEYQASRNRGSSMWCAMSTSRFRQMIITARTIVTPMTTV